VCSAVRGGRGGPAANLSNPLLGLGRCGRPSVWSEWPRLREGWPSQARRVSLPARRARPEWLAYPTRTQRRCRCAPAEARHDIAIGRPGRALISAHISRLPVNVSAHWTSALSTEKNRSGVRKPWRLLLAAGRIFCSTGRLADSNQQTVAIRSRMLLCQLELNAHRAAL